MLSQNQLLAERITLVTGSDVGINTSCAKLSSAPPEKENSVPEKKTYPFLGKQFTGQTVEYEGVIEPFSQYKLADGTTVKVKMIMVDAVRLDTHDDQGNPVYQFQFQQVIGIVPPDDLKRKPQ